MPKYQNIISLTFAMILGFQFAFAQKGIKLPPGVGIGIVASPDALTTEDYQRAKNALTPQQIAEFNKPATVQVFAYYNVTATYPEPSNFSFVLLKFEATLKAKQGLIPADDFSKLNFILARLAEDPSGYFTPTRNMQKVTLQLNSHGSGFFLNPEGFVVSNAHVVDVNMDLQRYKAAQFILNDIVSNQLDQLIKDYGGQADQNILQECVNAIINSYADKVMLSNEKVTYGIKTGKTMEDNDYLLPAKVVSKGEEIPGKDVAILKVESKGWPVAPVGDDTKLKTGDKLYVMGYPGAVEANATLKERAMREPSFTEGMMNARQETKEGWTAIQLDAATYHGNSGGPVFNQHGEVVGLLTFGSLNKDMTGLVQGFNFIVPMHVVAEFVRSQNIKASMGKNTLLFRKAIAARDEKKSEALTMFNELKSANPDWPYLTAHINEAAQIEPDNKINPKELGEQLNLRWFHYTGIGFLILSIVAFVVRKFS